MMVYRSNELIVLSQGTMRSSYGCQSRGHYVWSFHGQGEALFTLCILQLRLSLYFTLFDFFLFFFVFFLLVGVLVL